MEGAALRNERQEYNRAAGDYTRGRLLPDPPQDVVIDLIRLAARDDDLTCSLFDADGTVVRVCVHRGHVHGDSNPWAILDELLGIGAVADLAERLIGPSAFYGRCSTEDNQDPKTSRAWQRGNAAKFVEPIGGTIVEEFFDVGQSRSVTWDRRTEASRLLAALKDPNRTWNTVVVGEGTRCWFGNQFSLIAPRFEAHVVELWIPEPGGKFDARNRRTRC